MTKIPSQRCRRWLYGSVLVLVFLLAFLPRAIYPVSRSLRWYHRSIHFADALETGDWAATYHTYHPGVTTMWLAGLGIDAWARQRGLTSAQLLGRQPTRPDEINRAIAAGMIPIALVIALCTVVACVLLDRLIDRRAALAGGVLLALDPFHLARSKALHVDALLATFMGLSVLFLFHHLRRSSRPSLILSGAFAGLAFLTKTPSLFLVPYAALTVGTHELIFRSPTVPGPSSAWRRWVWRVASRLAVWAAAAAVIFVVLWPAMWVRPLEILGLMEDGAVFHVEVEHENPVYFAGEASMEDPGPLFYLATLAWKTTALSLPMALLTLIRARRQGDGRTWMTWLLLAYVVCFAVPMGLSAHKDMRYVLPVFAALDVLAAFGLVQILDLVEATGLFGDRRWPLTGLLVVTLGLHGAAILARHPYYGTHHNPLLGGSRVAKRVLPLQNEAEGLDLAAQYLNQLPRASQARAMVYPLGGFLFERTFLGYTSPGPERWTHYRVYYVNQLMRGLGGQAWSEAWQADKQRTPLWTLGFDGVTYVWVYGSPPEKAAAGGPEREVDSLLGDGIRLDSYRLSAMTVAPGDVLTVVLRWEAEEWIEESYTVFVHLLSAHGNLVAQRDAPPIYGVRPTSTWRVGEVIEDSHDILLPDDLPSGAYELSAGMYDRQTLARLPAHSSDGERLPDDRVVLGVVHVRAQGGSEEP